MSGVVMWPRKLPELIRSESRRAAEIRVFDALSDQLGHGWNVYYSRPWHGESPSGAEIDGECDFIVAHPSYGVLFIEVKGGAISYDPALDQWHSKDRHGIRHRIKNPVKQASDSKHMLLAKAKAERAWPAGFFRFRHGVVFPDVAAVPQNLGVDKPRELFATRLEMQVLGDWVVQRLSGGSEAPLGDRAMKVLEQLLAGPIQLHAPLAFAADDDDAAIQNLTPQQFHILTAIEGLRRVAVSGGAGTGKTVLVCEDARRQASAGLRTLVTCGSPRLAEHIRADLRDTSIEVATFDQIAHRLGAEAGRIRKGEVVLGELLPDLVLDSLNDRPDLAYEAVIVDEAQDFPMSAWIAIDSLPGIGSSSTLHAYFDSNQRLYGDLRTQFDSYTLLPVRLSRNLRNTQNIHEAAQRFYRGPLLTADGPVGSAVHWVSCEEAGVVREVVLEVKRLVNLEKVRASDIAVLASSDGELGNLSSTLGRQIECGLTLTTISEFKGLERRFVIVLGTRGISDNAELAYVALSRARAYLTVIGSAEVLRWLNSDAVGEEAGRLSSPA